MSLFRCIQKRVLAQTWKLFFLRHKGFAEACIVLSHVTDGKVGQALLTYCIKEWMIYKWIIIKENKVKENHWLQINQWGLLMYTTDKKVWNLLLVRFFLLYFNDGYLITDKNSIIQWPNIFYTGPKIRMISLNLQFDFYTFSRKV